MKFKDLARLVEASYKRERFEGKPEAVIYYADGRYFNKNFMVYSYDNVWGYHSWIQSGYSDVKQLKQFRDFQERVQ